MNENQVRALNGAGKKDEFTGRYGDKISANVKAAVEAMEKEKSDAATKITARFMLSVSSTMDVARDLCVARIREARAEIGDNKKSLNRMDAAIAFGLEENNWLMACQLTCNHSTVGLESIPYVNMKDDEVKAFEAFEKDFLARPTQAATTAVSTDGEDKKA